MESIFTINASIRGDVIFCSEKNYHPFGEQKPAAIRVFNTMDKK